MRDEYEVVADERVNTEIHAKKLLWWRLTIYGFLAWIKYDTVWTTVVALYESCFHQRNVNFILQASVVGVIRKVSWITVIILSDRMLYFIRTVEAIMAMTDVGFVVHVCWLQLQREQRNIANVSETVALKCINYPLRWCFYLQCNWKAHCL